MNAHPLARPRYDLVSFADTAAATVDKCVNFVFGSATVSTSPICTLNTYYSFTAAAMLTLPPRSWVGMRILAI
jgi:hypothetical protein